MRKGEIAFYKQFLLFSQYFFHSYISLVRQNAVLCGNSPKQALFFTILQNKSFENTMGKKKLRVISNSHFPTEFSILLETFPPFCNQLLIQGKKRSIAETEVLFNPFPNKPWCLRVCSISLLMTLWEKEKRAISPFATVFQPFEELSAIFIKVKIVVCKLF